jgi:hypothetical protein
LKKDRQHNDQKKRTNNDLQNTTQKTWTLSIAYCKLSQKKTILGPGRHKDVEGWVW